MKTALFKQAIGKYTAGLLLVAALVFLPAGTICYPAGWRLCALLFLPMLLLGAVLFLRAPALLEKRLRSREEAGTQKWVVGCSSLMFVAGFVTAGLDFRFGWSHVPGWLTAAASVVMLVGYGLYGEVMRENAYLSRTVELQEDQRVIDSGLYAVVRHPMYAASILLFLSIPLVLGSWLAFGVFLIYPALLVKRIRHEEEILTTGLPGYRAYMKKVIYRMIPFIW